MKHFSFLFIVLVLFSLSSCTAELNETSEKVMQAKTEQLLQEANKEIGMPAIVNFTEKKQLKWIYELCDQEGLVCYAYLFNEMEGKIGQYLGECIGYGIPYSTQFSNPNKIVEADKQIGYNMSGLILESMPQAEPNGLFKPEGLSATWLIMIDPVSKQPRPVYVEPLIIVSPFKLY